MGGREPVRGRRAAGRPASTTRSASSTRPNGRPCSGTSSPAATRRSTGRSTSPRSWPGLRQGELIALRWRDVDWVAGRIRVRQNCVLGEFDTPKCKRATRSVPMADRLAGELDRLYKARGRAGDDELVFADPITGEPLDKAANLAATARRSRPQRSTRRTACTGCGTRSGRGWPRPACRCARSRSGWATATSRPRSATRTTRRARTRRTMIERACRPEVTFNVPF